MTTEQLDKLVAEVRDQYEIQPHEVVLVGERRAEHKDRRFNPETDDAKKFITETFKFTRNSVVKADAQALGQKSNRFYHLLVAQPGGETVTLPDGRKVKRSNRSNKYGWHVLFEREGVTFDEIKDEVVAGSYEIVGTPDEGKVKLNNYVLMGAWCEVDCGFRFRIHSADATGKMVALESYRRDPATGKMVKSIAEDRLVRFFVMESQYPTLRTMIANRVEQAEKYKIASPVTTSDPGAENVVVDTTAAPAEGAGETTETKSEI